jgi:hypothetical protein
MIILYEYKRNTQLQYKKEEKRETEIQQLPKTTSMYCVNNSLSCFYTC